ncbi:DUF3087 family protein [Granulosicoccus antarcticus]|uniref:DUF3087 domain-containing protein n=1 Tax=Granulosicoccus antarcticus IMCC3135 TaxID=1192854 RepID=A0A2Z2NS51_9GAMM|nr:DUF3087 family protein [Granulosicoccus antarcticus]ASJ72831.1 hypothetical protein IMCC3135_13730 [Granulosicoccus antarcticus IMCC3135]
MKLRAIDKQRYSKHYKIIFAAIVVQMMIVSIVCSSLLISWFSTPEESHFILNLIGVVLAALIAAYVIYHCRDNAFMNEVVYVWNLKKQLNRIYRKQRKIEPLIEDNNVDAMIIMNFMYKGSRQLYELDDNTITLDNLAAMSRLLDTRMEQHKIKITTDDYHPDLLAQF